jgi:hypothetical protein
MIDRLLLEKIPLAGIARGVLFFYRGLEPNYHKPSDRQIDPKLVNETVEAACGIHKRKLLQ